MLYAAGHLVAFQYAAQTQVAACDLPLTWDALH